MRLRFRFPLMCMVMCAALSRASGQTPEDQVRALIDQVSLDSLVHHVRALSGEDSVFFPQQDPFLISTRFAGSTGHALAEYYLDVALPAVYHESFVHFGEHGTNLFTIHPSRAYGDSPPDSGWQVLYSSVHEWPDKYILCAHYDSYSREEGLAPGADDNASGVAVVLEAARLLKQLDTRYSVVFALFDLEERGTLGSEAYTSRALAVNEDIRGVINLDMVGWNTDPGRPDVDVWIAHDSAHPEFVETILSLNERYDIGLVRDMQYHSYSSDHIEFRDAGYPSTVITEGMGYGTRYPYYHTDGDTIGNFNLDLFHRRAKLAVAAIAHYALGVDEAGVGSEMYAELPVTLTLSQNYPNPFNLATTISYGLQQSADVTLAVYDVLGREVRELASGTKPAGTYEVSFDASGLPSGVYIYRLQAEDYVETKRMVIVK